MENNRLYKREKLCSHTAVNLLFAQGKSAICYPLRAVFRVGDARPEAPVRFLITIPKKKDSQGSGQSATAPPRAIGLSPESQSVDACRGRCREKCGRGVYLSKQRTGALR